MSKALLGFPSDVPTTDYADIKANIDRFGGGFERVAANLQHGGEAAKLAVQFLERWYKVELAYTKSVEDLLESKPANLIPSRSMFGHHIKGECVEPVPELRGAWGAFIGEIASVNDDRRRVAEAVRDTIWSRLSKFSDQVGQRQDNLISEARKVLSHAKTNMADLIAKDVRFKAACRTAAEDVLLVAPAYEPEKKNDIMAVLKSSTKAAIKASKIKQTPILDPAVMTPPQKRRMATMMAELASPSVQKVLDNIKEETETFHRAVTLSRAQINVTYTEFMPKIMRTLHDVELQRISFMKHCIGHIATGFRGTAKKTLFEESRRRVDLIMPNVVKSCVITEPLPPPPEFEEPDWGNIIADTSMDLDADSDSGDGDAVAGAGAPAPSVDTAPGSPAVSTSSLASVDPAVGSGGGSVRGWFTSKIKASASPGSRRKFRPTARTPEPQRKATSKSSLGRGSQTPEPTRKGLVAPGGAKSTRPIESSALATESTSANAGIVDPLVVELLTRFYADRHLAVGTKSPKQIQALAARIQAEGIGGVSGEMEHKYGVSLTAFRDAAGARPAGEDKQVTPKITPIVEPPISRADAMDRLCPTTSRDSTASANAPLAGSAAVTPAAAAASNGSSSVAPGVMMPTIVQTEPTDDDEKIKYPGTPPIFSRRRQLSSPYFNIVQPSYQGNTPLLKRRSTTMSLRSMPSPSGDRPSSTGLGVPGLRKAATSPTTASAAAQKQYLLSPAQLTRDRALSDPTLMDRDRQR